MSSLLVRRTLTHVRWFRHEAEIGGRYGHLISIRAIERIPCPLIQGRG